MEMSVSLLNESMLMNKVNKKMSFLIRQTLIKGNIKNYNNLI